MKTLLLRAVVFLGSSALGLLIAGWLIKGVTLRAWGFVVAVVIFSVAQAILAPFVAKLATRYASAFLGGIGLASTLLALILATLFSSGLSIRGIGAWIGATVVVWLVSALATVLLPKLLIKQQASG